MRILVASPHPDDEILGCGDTLLKHVEAGDEVFVIYFTCGYSDTEREVRRKEIEKVAKELPITLTFNLELKDGFITYSEEAVKKIMRNIRTVRHRRVYLPHPNEQDRDHRETFETAFEAVKRAGLPYYLDKGDEPHSVKEILCYEVWTPLTKFNYVVDISEEMERKIYLLKLYRSQLRIIKYHEAIKGLNRYRGATTRKGNYCEVFDILKTEL